MKSPRCVKSILVATLWLASSAGLAEVAGPQAPISAELLANAASVPTVSLPALDMQRLRSEDVFADALKTGPLRFAISRDVAMTPANSGAWTALDDGRSMWRMRVEADEAAHLNFGFGRFALPPGAELRITSPDGSYSLGPFTRADQLPHGQLWTQIIPGDSALLILTVPAELTSRVELELNHINQGYRGFGAFDSTCKSGACNMDVACLATDDPWNKPRRAVGAYTRNGTDTCTGSLLNNTANDRRMLFATARHCNITSTAIAATVLVYWNYESPTCRTPGSSASGQPLPKPNTTSAGLTFLATTNNPFNGGADPAGSRSDFALIELATPAPDNPFNLYWAGWDRRAPPTVCSAPGDPTSAVGLCASIHHPSVDEKRITFMQEDMTLDNINSATGVHWRANWDPTPPVSQHRSPSPCHRV